MKLPDKIYVVISEHGGSKDSVPIAWETYLDEISSTREAALRRANIIAGRYGKTTIARLVFDEDDLLVEQLESQKEYEKHEFGTFDTWF